MATANSDRADTAEYSLDSGEFTLAVTLRDDLSNEFGTAVQKIKL